jgi:subtilase family serine protease
MRWRDMTACPAAQSTLDIQYIAGVGTNVPTTFFSLGGPGPTKDPPGAFILDWAMAVANMTTAPIVTSISYGDSEWGFYQKFGNYDYITRMELELAKMALRGYTVIAGSGDAGVSNVGELGNDLGEINAACTPFNPFYPSSSHYVLSVGSTFLTPNAQPVCYDALSNTHQPIVCDTIGEVSVSLRNGIHWTSGGGFTNISTCPEWQTDAVTEFFKNVPQDSLPPAGVYNPAGRAYPDLVRVPLAQPAAHAERQV